MGKFLFLLFFVLSLTSFFFLSFIRFIKVANETMCRPIRALTEARGHATSKHMYAFFFLVPRLPRNKLFL